MSSHLIRLPTLPTVPLSAPPLGPPDQHVNAPLLAPPTPPTFYAPNSLTPPSTIPHWPPPPQPGFIYSRPVVFSQPNSPHSPHSVPNRSPTRHLALLQYSHPRPALPSRPVASHDTVLLFSPYPTPLCPRVLDLLALVPPLNGISRSAQIDATAHSLWTIPVLLSPRFVPFLFYLNGCAW
ncbi:hypothetical protein B0H13DRAFT_2351077 [Mycena leptocephala]|nr:hypothetical protein B0H13DRAFT_2351077 [Mycena leptocephala]